MSTIQITTDSETALAKRKHGAATVPYLHGRGESFTANSAPRRESYSFTRLNRAH